LAKFGFASKTGSSRDFAAFIASELKSWAAVVELTGIQADRARVCASLGGAAQSQKANVLVSMLSRGGALCGVSGSSKAEWAVKRVGTLVSVSNTLNTIAS
jgi:hypothetical protein